MRKRSLVLLLASVLSLASCGKKNVTPPGGTVSSVALSQSTIDVQLGKRSSDVTVTVEGEGDYNKKVKLSSENEAVATTSFTEVEDGETFKVYAHSVGTAKINVVSVQDETKAASLTVNVKTKETVIEPEILSFYVSETSKMFEVNGDPYDFELTVTGKGEFSKSATIAVTQDAEHPCISVDKTEVESGQKFRVTPLAVTGEAAINVTSKQDSKKTVQVQVAVRNSTPPEPQPVDSVSLDYQARTLEVADTFNLTSEAVGGNVTWKIREKGSEVLADTSTYISLSNKSNTGITVTALAEVDEVNVRASVSETVYAECKFTVQNAPSDVRDLYVSKNAHLDFDDIYFYAWNDKGQSNAAFPGTKLTTYELNTNNERCYEFTVDVLKYPNFLFNNGEDPEGENFKKTLDCSFENLGVNDNVWFDGDTYHFAVMEKDVPTVHFTGIANNVLTLSNENISEVVHFSFRKGTPVLVETDAEDCITVDDSNLSSGSFTVAGKKAGEASIKVKLFEDENVFDTLTVKVVDASQLTTLYFSNSLGWENVYLYMWGNDVNNAWPGDKLTNPLKNKEGQDVYVLHIPAIYTSLVLSNGLSDDALRQSENISKNDERLAGEINNLWLKEEQNDDGSYKFGFAKFEAFTYSVAFASNTVTLDKDGKVKVSVSANASGVTYNITSGSNFVRIIKGTDSELLLEWVAEGTATIVAALGDKTATLTVECTNVPAETQDRDFIFSNNHDWEHVYLYVWDSGTRYAKSDWPGDELTHVLGQNKYGQDLYDFAIDEFAYDSFILNEGETGEKTSDIKLSEHTDESLNNIWLGDKVGETNEFTPGFAEFKPIEPHELDVTVEVGANKEIAIASIIDAGLISVTSLNEGVATTTSITSGHITITGVSVGNTKVKLSYGVAPDDITAEIDVHVVEENKVTYYFYKGYDVYTDFSLYLFNSVSDTPKTAWPGDALTGATVKNAAGKDCYAVEVDRNLYDAFILVAKEGVDEKQTDNVLFADYVGKNMFGFGTGEGSWHDIGDNTWRCHIAAGVYSAFVYSVAFNEDDVTVYEGHDLTVGVTANAAGVSYSVTSGADKVSVVNAESNDHQVTLHFEAAGSAEVTATLEGVHAVLTVTTSAEPVPEDNKTFVFSNNQNWEHVYVYAFGAGNVKNAEYPGVELTTKLGKNKHGQDLYEFSLNKNAYTGFIVNEGTDARKTSDIMFASISDYSLNNIYLGDRVGDEGSKVYTPQFVKFHAIEPDEFAVTVEVGKTLDVNVSSIFEANTITVASSDTGKVTTTQIAAGKITLTGVAAGAANITLTHGVAPNVVQETIAVNVVEENLATYYFYTGINSFTGLHLYLFNSTSKAAKTEFPGDALTGATVRNVGGEVCYEVEVNKNLYDSFILVAWEGDQRKKTDDVKFSEHASSNMFGFSTANNAWHQNEESEWVCSIAAGTFSSHEHSFDPETHLCDCGEAAPGYAAITFTVNYNTGGYGDVYIFGIGPGTGDAYWANNRHAMTHVGDNNWSLTLVVPTGVQYEYKFAVVWHAGGDTWENGANRTLNVSESGTLPCSWQS